MPGDPLPKRAEEKAYRLLTRRGHSEKELAAKLRHAGFPESLIAGVIEKCRALGYLDDAAYARARARDLAVNRLLGNRRIFVDLREKGIPEELGRQAMAEARAEIGEEEALEALLRRRTRRNEGGLGDNREKARLARSLLGKGFPRGLVFRKLKVTGEESVHDDDGE